jgi:transposase
LWALRVPSPKLVPLVLSDAERASLGALSRKRTASQALALRARIVLSCAENGGIAQLTAVAGQTGVSRESARKWRTRFAERGMKGLTDAKRPGAPRKITDEQVEVAVTRVLTEKGPGRDAHCSTRAMAAQTGLVAVVGVADLAGLRPRAAPRRDVEAVLGPAVHRQGPRRRRPLHEPARARPGPGRGREVPSRPSTAPPRACPSCPPRRPG